VVAVTGVDGQVLVHRLPDRDAVGRGKINPGDPKGSLLGDTCDGPAQHLAKRVARYEGVVVNR